MRTKEVKEAIELLHNEILSIKEGLEKGWYYGERYNLEQEVKKKETLLNYISELEKENEKYKNFQLHISGMRSGKELLTRYIKDSILKIR